MIKQKNMLLHFHEHNLISNFYILSTALIIGRFFMTHVIKKKHIQNKGIVIVHKLLEIKCPICFILTITRELIMICIKVNISKQSLCTFRLKKK